jgi:thioredoxin 1
MSTQSVNRIFNLLVGGCVLVVLVWFLTQKSTLNIEPPQDEWFQRQVVQQSNPVLVKFGAKWCGPCRFTDNALEEYQRVSSFPIPVVTIDVDEKPELAAHYGVRGIPRLFLMHQGKILDHQSGGMDSESITRWIASQTSSLQ